MNIATITIDEQSDEIIAGARSYIYRSLAEAFSYPSDAFCEDLLSGGWAQRLDSLTEHLPYVLTTWGDEWMGSATAESLQSGYISTIEVGAGKPYCPLYEGSHRSGRMKLMEDLVRFYEHFGLKIQPGDQPDHVCAELEFMHYMCFKEAAAYARGDPVADLRRAQRDFLDRHLCRWLPRVRRRMEGADGLPAFYGRAAGFAEEVCRRDLEWLRST
jgi:DMSO reductase family type II enzyme chaperone